MRLFWKKTGKIASLLLAFLLTVQIVPGVSAFADSSTDSPVIFRLTDEVKPGDVFQIYGYALNKMELKVLCDNVPLEIVYKNPDGAYIAAVLAPENPGGAPIAPIAPGVHEIKVTAPGFNASRVLLLNAARPNWLQWDVGYEGLDVKIVGVNLDASAFGGAANTLVKLSRFNGGAEYPASVKQIEPYSVTFTVPWVGALNEVYDVWVSNDGGLHWTMMDRAPVTEYWTSDLFGQTFTVIPAGSDPYGLGAAWEVNYDYDPAHVADVTDYGAAGDGVTDDTAAIQRASAAVSGFGGGTLYFPSGTYLTSDLPIPGNGVVMGEDEDAAVISLINRGTVHSLQDQWFTRTNSPSRNVAKSYQGIYNITIERNPASPMANWWLNVGDGFDNRNQAVFRGFFLKNVKINYDDEPDQGWAHAFTESYMYGYVLVDGTEQNGYAGVFNAVKASHFTSRNNVYNVKTTSDCVDGMYVVEENNETHIVPSAHSWLPKNGSVLKTNFYSAHNSVYGAATVTNGATVYSGDPVSGDAQFAYPGRPYGQPTYNSNMGYATFPIGYWAEFMTINGSSDNTLTGDNGGSLFYYNSFGFDDNSTYFNRPGRAFYGYLVAVIVSGKGMGQVRKITRHQPGNDPNYILEKTWDVQPDSSSVIYVGNLAHNSVIYDNYAENCDGAFSFAGGALDSVIANNTGVAMMGAGNRTRNRMTPQPETAPSFYVSILNNDFDGVSPGNGTVGVYSGLSYEMSGASDLGWNQYGIVIRGNAVSNGLGTPSNAYGAAQGVSVLAGASGAGNLPDRDLISAVIVADNTLTNLSDGVTLGAKVDGAILQNNVYSNVAREESYASAKHVMHYPKLQSEKSGSTELYSLSVNGPEGPLALEPAFDPSVLAYTVSVPYIVKSVTVSAVAGDSDAAVTVSGPLSDLAMGGNRVAVTVLSANGENTEDYVITVIRREPGDSVIPPVVFKMQEEIKPGDSFQLYGEGLNDPDLRVFASGNGLSDPAELDVIQTDPEGHFAVAVLSGGLPPGVYEISVKNVAVAEPVPALVSLNAAKPFWLQWDIAWPGQELQIMGVNFTLERLGGTADTVARLVPRDGGLGTAAGIAKLEPYSVIIVIPEVAPGDYNIEISNDGGAHWGMVGDEQLFRVVPAGQDPLGLGVAWADNYVYDNVVNVKDFGAKGDGYANDTAAINAALDRIAADGGGILYFPKGEYLATKILLPAKTIMKGEDRDETRLLYSAFADDGLGRVRERAFIEARKRAGDYADGNWHGITDMTLGVQDGVDLPNFIFWVGDGWGAFSTQGNKEFEGMFVTHVTLDCEIEYYGPNAREYSGYDDYGNLLSYGGIRKYLLELDNDMTGLRGFVTPIMATYHTKKDCSFNIISSSNESVSCYTIYENCDITMDPDYFTDDGYFVGAQGMFLRTNFYAAHNTIVNTGSSQDNGGETVCGEGSHHETSLGWGTVAENINPTTVRLDPERFNDGTPCRLVWDRNKITGDSSYGYYVAMIMDGKGMGQSRRVKSYDDGFLRNNTLNYDFNSATFVLEVTKPWDIQPDETSKIWIGTTSVECFVYANDMRNAKNASFTYGGAIDCFFADNISNNTMGVGSINYQWIAAADDRETDAGLMDRAKCAPCYYVSYNNNVLDGAARLTDNMGVFVVQSFEQRNGYRFGYMQYGVIMKDNVLKNAPYKPDLGQTYPTDGRNTQANALGVPQGLSVVLDCYRTPVGPSAPTIKGVLIESNQLENMDGGIYVGNALLPGRHQVECVTGVVIRGNVFNKTASTITVDPKVRNAAVIGNDLDQAALPVTPAPASVSTSSMRKGTVGVAYAWQLLMTGTRLNAGVLWSVAEGSLPPGLSLDQTTGTVSGTPTIAGFYTFTVKVENAAGSGVKELSILVSEKGDLRALSLTGSVAPLSPAFDPHVYAYTATVAGSVDSIRIVAAPRYQVRDKTVPAPYPLATIVAGDGVRALSVGENTFAVTVGDRGATKTYEIIVTRLDTSALEALISQAQTILAGNLNSYSAGGVSNLERKLDGALEARNAMTQREIDDAAGALDAAIRGLRQAVLVCPVKSMLAKIAKLQRIPYEWDGVGALTFATSNGAVCGVTQDGTLVPFKAGIAVITITAPDGTKTIFAVTVSA